MADDDNTHQNAAPSRRPQSTKLVRTQSGPPRTTDQKGQGSMGSGDEVTDKLIDAIVESSELAIPQRAFVLVVGLDHDGTPVLSEVWINIEDLDQRVDEYTKCADIAYIQQGLIAKQTQEY